MSIPEGLDYEKHYAAFKDTEIDKLESKSRKIQRKAHELKRSCRHPEQHLQWLSQGKVDLFYCGTCGVSFTHEARDRSQDFFDLIRKRMKETAV
jgi:hypothetical protein